MVDRVYERNASDSAPQPPADPSTGYPTAGNPTQGVPATLPGPYWYHMITESLRRVVVGVGLEPDHLNLDLVTAAVRKAATESMSGIASIATQAETNDGNDDSKFITAKKLKAWGVQWVKQATETVAGMLKVATQTQVDAGDDDVTAVTPKKLRWGISYTIGERGYLILPSWLGGFIVQWGLDGAANAVEFPIAFPNNCLNVQATDLSSGTNAGNHIVAVDSLTLTNFALRNSNGAGGACYWLAIGN